MTDEAEAAVPTGEALFRARLRVGYTLNAAADALHIPSVAMSAYESGLRTPSEDLINELADLYGVERGRLASRPWVPKVPPQYDPVARTLSIGWHTIQVHEGDNEHLIRSLAAVIRSMRSISESQPVVLRSGEFPLLGSLLDLGDEDLVDHLERYLGVTPTEALKIINEMVASNLAGLSNGHLGAVER